jgi:hypothetical protein
LNPFDVTNNASTGNYINAVLVKNNINSTINVTENGAYAIKLIEEAASILKASVTAK